MHDGGTALAPWCAQAQQCADATHAARIVQEATEAPNTSVFGELLAFPAIQALFATGTWLDYVANASTYTQLTEAQIVKLRQLTILSMAHRSRVLSYAELQRALGLDTPADSTHATRTLEDLVIDGIYQSFFAGRLDGLAREFHVDQVTARDVPRLGADGSASDALAPLLAALQTWAQRAERAVHMLDEHIAQTQQDSRTRAQTRAADQRPPDGAPEPSAAASNAGGRPAVRRSKRSRA
ncbi:hypothetical protein CBS14141_002531 [Malassezia furfur]|nr:hypothetical protein CBS14141_002531 [Malassezia furfur]